MLKNLICHRQFAEMAEASDTKEKGTDEGTDEGETVEQRLLDDPVIESRKRDSYTAKQSPERREPPSAEKAVPGERTAVSLIHWLMSLATHLPLHEDWTQ